MPNNLFSTKRYRKYYDSWKNWVHIKWNFCTMEFFLIIIKFLWLKKDAYANHFYFIPAVFRVAFICNPHTHKYFNHDALLWNSNKKKKSQREFKIGPQIIRHLATKKTSRMITKREDKPLFWAKSFPFSQLRVLRGKNRGEVSPGLSANKGITLFDKACNFSTQTIFPN